MFNWIASAFISVKTVLVGTAIVIGLIHTPSPVAPVVAQTQEPVQVVATSSVQEVGSTTPATTIPTKKTVVAPMPTQTTPPPASVAPISQSPQQTQFVTPSGAIIDAQGHVLNQDQIDAQNYVNNTQSTAAQNALRLQQAQAAASSSQAQQNAIATQALKTLINGYYQQIADLNDQLIAKQSQLTNLWATIQQQDAGRGVTTASAEMQYDTQSAQLNTDISNLNLQIAQIQNEILRAQVQ